MGPWCASRGRSFASRERRTDWGAKSDGVGGSGDVPEASERCFEAGWIGEGDGLTRDDLDNVPKGGMTKIGGGSTGNDRGPEGVVRSQIGV